MPDRSKSPHSRERGAATVEMAIVTIFLFILVAGIVDIGRALYAFIGVQEAAQEGAIFGSFDPSDLAAVRNRAADAVEFPVLDPNADITAVCDTTGDPDLMIVTVSHSVDLITPVVGQWFGPTIDLERTVTGQVFLGCP